MSNPWRKLTLALGVIAVMAILVAALIVRQRGPLGVVLTGNGVAKDGRTSVATFLLTNRTTRGFIAFGKNSPDALYCEYRDTWSTGQTNWFDDYAPGQIQWVVDVDPHSGVTFSVPLPPRGCAREFAVMYAAKPKEKPSRIDAVAKKLVQLYRRYFPEKGRRTWYAGVLWPADEPTRK